MINAKRKMWLWREREDALPLATSRAEPYASELTTAFGGLANFILIGKQSKEKHAIILSLPNKKDRYKTFQNKRNNGAKRRCVACGL